MDRKTWAINNNSENYGNVTIVTWNF